VWQRALWAPTGADALAYLRVRGLPDALIRREGIGLATDALADELRRQGLDPAAAHAAGLLRRDGRTTFAGRVVLWEWRHVEGGRTPVWATARPPISPSGCGGQARPI
ncbi:hypothetical protein B4Q13_22140, partial [Lacticaseibacillus rhamnosus]